MFPTVEVRWFHKGPVPPRVTAWFEQTGKEPGELAKRTDYYLRLAGGDALSIKLREGKIEVKQRQQQLGISRFHQRVTGNGERWRKWSFALAGNIDTLDKMLMPSGSRIGVYKARRLRRYLLSGNLPSEIEASDDWPLTGCHFELTELGIRGETWWSVCLEAFGLESTLQKNLALVAGLVMVNAQPPFLNVDDSYGYPYWLAQTLARTKGDRS